MSRAPLNSDVTGLDFGAASACGPGVPISVLDGDLAALRQAFNDARGDARLVFIVGPSCAGCLLGLTEMRAVLSDMLAQHDRLHVFIVFVPQLAAQESQARLAARYLQGDRVRHYWDARGASGELFQQILGVSQYAWNVWMMFTPEAAWDDEDPPAPLSWMHQLYGLPEASFLEARAFAADVRALLDGLP